MPYGQDWQVLINWAELGHWIRHLLMKSVAASRVVEEHLLYSPICVEVLIVNMRLKDLRFIVSNHSISLKIIDISASVVAKKNRYYQINILGPNIWFIVDGNSTTQKMDNGMMVSWRMNACRKQSCSDFWQTLALGFCWCMSFCRQVEYLLSHEIEHVVWFRLLIYIWSPTKTKFLYKPTCSMQRSKATSHE